MMRHTIYVLSLLALLTSCSEPKNDTIQLFAAAGTRVSMQKICNNFTKETGLEVDQNYASSGTLARQIKNGANADYYISANEDWVKYLSDAGLLVDSTIIEIAQNKLAIITSVEKSDFTIEYTPLFNINKIVPDKITIGDPAYVPVGKYAQQLIDSLGWQATLQGKTIRAKDVTSVCQMVALGECDWGIVYYTEAIQSDKVKIISEVPSSLHSPIVFYMAQIKKTELRSDGFYDFTQNDSSKAIFKTHGYQL